MIFAICGPTGSGKTTLVQDLLKLFPGSKKFITYTTRNPRDNEVDGIDYHFVDRGVYELLQDYEIEHEEYNGNLYFTCKPDILSLMEQSDVVFCVLTPLGISKIIEQLPGKIIVIEIIPEDPHLQLLKRSKLTGESEEQLAQRSQRILDDCISQYNLREDGKIDHSIINKNGLYTETLNQIEEIVKKYVSKDKG